MYHTYDNHIKPMLEFIDKELHMSEDKKKILKLAAIFHDIVYSPISKTNEDDSIEYFKWFVSQEYIPDEVPMIIHNAIGDGYGSPFFDITEEEKAKVMELINNTKEPFNLRYGDELGHIFAKLDTYVLTQDYPTLLEYENNIYEEYKNYYSLEDYKKGRVDFLNKAKELPNANKNGLESLINHVKTKDYGSLGIMVGSFNPFHIGHLNVLKQAQKVFGKVIVVQLQDFNKPKNKYALPELDCLCVQSDKLLSEVVEELSIGYNKNKVSVVRALRNGDDLQHEQNLKQTVGDLSSTKINFTYFLADVKFQHISSSLVRSLPEELAEKYKIEENEK